VKVRNVVRATFRIMNRPGLNGTTQPSRKRPKPSRRNLATKAERAARRKFIAESRVKPSAEGMAAVRRELYGTE
jgi:hypothetical protein